MPSVPTTTSTSPSQARLGDRAAAARAERCRSRAPRRRPRARRSGGASSTISASGATSPSIENTESVTISRPAAPSRAAVAAQAPLEVLDVAVAVDDDLGARQPAAVDDRGVVELVGEDRVAAAGERADHAEVGEVARAEQHARLAALERRQALLQAPVDRHRARHQPRGARADAPAHRRLGRRLAHARVVGQAEVVVRAQQQHRPAVEQHGRPLRSADQAQAAGEAEPLELLQALLRSSLISALPLA